MHELNICLSLIRLLEKRFLEMGANKRITKIWIEVGELAGIDIDALKFSFPIAAKRTIAEKSIIEIISIPGCAWCNICKKNCVIKKLFDPCKTCGYFDFNVTQGKELHIKKIEVK